MNLPKNPYKDLPSEQRRKIIGEVGTEDWNRLLRALPQVGLMDRVIGNLFSAFIQELNEQNIPKYYEPENASRISRVLKGITFQQTRGH